MLTPDWWWDTFGDNEDPPDLAIHTEEKASSMPECVCTSIELTAGTFDPDCRYHKAWRDNNGRRPKTQI